MKRAGVFCRAAGLPLRRRVLFFYVSGKLRGNFQRIEIDGWEMECYNIDNQPMAYRWRGGADIHKRRMSNS